MNDEEDGSEFNADNFHACFMAVAQAASRLTTLRLISPPPHGEYKAMPILQPLVHLEYFELVCGFGEFVEPLMTAISRRTPPNLIRLSLEDPAAVLYLVQPACLHIAHSLMIFTVHLPKRMTSPVDILPYLLRLERFDACNLCLPIYSPDSLPPLTFTLRFLELKSVSVQWMAGHVSLPSSNATSHSHTMLTPSTPYSLSPCHLATIFNITPMIFTPLHSFTSLH